MCGSKRVSLGIYWGTWVVVLGIGVFINYKLGHITVGTVLGLKVSGLRKFEVCGLGDLENSEFKESTACLGFLEL